MSTSPAERAIWPRVALTDVCLLITDGEHTTPPRLDQPAIPLVTAKNVRDGWLDLGATDFVSLETARQCWQRCQPRQGDILLVCVGSIGRLCLLQAPPAMVLVRSVALLRPNPARVLPRYLEDALKSPQAQAQIRSRVRKSAQAGLYLNQIKELTVPLPPLAEQRRIVARVDELAGRIQEARGLRRAALAEGEAILGAALEAVFRPMQTLEHHPLATLTSKIGSGATPLGGQAVYLSAGIPLIRSMNVRMRWFDWAGITYIDADTHHTMLGTRVQAGDVLLNITGASIGRVTCAPGELGEGNVNQHVAIIRPTERVLPRYLMYWLSKPAVQAAITQQQKGATRQALTKAQIAAFRVPVPPLAEQRRMVAYLDGVQAQADELKRLHTESAAELDALLPAVLEQAFRGAL